LATRAAKSKVDAGELVTEWRARAARFGFGEREIALLVGRLRSDDLNESRWEKVFDAMARPTGITSRSATFADGDVTQALCEALPAGSPIDANELERAACRRRLKTGPPTPGEN
jgi:hypothetical protein